MVETSVPGCSYSVRYCRVESRRARRGRLHAAGKYLTGGINERHNFSDSRASGVDYRKKNRIGFRWPRRSRRRRRRDSLRCYLRNIALSVTDSSHPRYDSESRLVVAGRAKKPGRGTRELASIIAVPPPEHRNRYATRGGGKGRTKG